MFAKNFGVIVHHIADTGFLAALRDKDPRVRREARKLFGRIGKPLFVCEPVLTEAAHLVSPLLIARMVTDGDLLIRFSVQEQIGRIRELLEKYSARMDLADACVVRMSELFPDCLVYTSDVEDFRIYRRFGDKGIPCHFIG